MFRFANYGRASSALRLSLVRSRGRCNFVQVSEAANGVVRITLNNPSKRNALSFQVLDDLESALKNVSANEDARCAIIGAAGSVFCSGHDLAELRNAQDTANQGPTAEAIFEKCSHVMQLIQAVPVPVVAQVSGLATAAGCQLVASCDLAVAGESARFATPGVHIGLFCTTPGVAIARSLPHKQALKMLFTGEAMSAHDARRFGLVSEVIADDNLSSYTQALAERISRASRDVLRLGKLAFYQQSQLPLSSAYPFASDIMVRNLCEVPDCTEGLDAFFAKRPAQWSRRT